MSYASIFTSDQADTRTKLVKRDVDKQSNSPGNIIIINLSAPKLRVTNSIK